MNLILVFKAPKDPFHP